MTSPVPGDSCLGRLNRADRAESRAASTSPCVRITLADATRCTRTQCASYAAPHVLGMQSAATQATLRIRQLLGFCYGPDLVSWSTTPLLPRGVLPSISLLESLHARPPSAGTEIELLADYGRKTMDDGSKWVAANPRHPVTVRKWLRDVSDIMPLPVQAGPIDVASLLVVPTRGARVLVPGEVLHIAKGRTGVQ